MPLTEFQKAVARVLAANRNPESYVAGGAVINRGPAGLRISDDLDIFHDVAARVVESASADEKSLQAAGYAVTWTLRGEGIVKAVVTRGDESVRLDWTTDSAFRFFPVLPDEELGYRLHDADLATNKVLALAGRSEVRDFLDILLIDQSYLSLGAAIWAACGKDPGFTPGLMLDQTNRHARYQDSDLKGEHLVRPVDLRELKRQWLEARSQAELLFEQLPANDLGCLYLDNASDPVTPDPTRAEFPALKRHFGCVRGAWPRIS
ncbi:MAG: hypothetical protein K2R98_16455 [Gemmataceae bacterium]|nr:hypothetical protein [Gemmataceae bacterium]